MNKYAQLHEYLRAALDDLQTKCEPTDIKSARIYIEATFDTYDGELEIKYTVSKRYDSGPSGNDLGPVMDEFLRRYGWDQANNMKLLTSD